MSKRKFSVGTFFLLSKIYRSGILEAAPYHTSIARFLTAYRIEMEHFTDCIKEGRKEAAVTEKTTTATIKICLACDRAAKTGNAVNIDWEAAEVPDGYVMKKLKF